MPSLALTPELLRDALHVSLFAYAEARIRVCRAHQRRPCRAQSEWGFGTGDTDRIVGGSRSTDGAAYELEADARTAYITLLYADPLRTCELPTAWLIDALEQWASYLETRGSRCATDSPIFRSTRPGAPWPRREAPLDPRRGPGAPLSRRSSNRR